MPTRVANGKAPAKPLHRVATLDDLLSRQPRREEVPIHLDEAAFRTYEEAARSLALTENDATREAFDAAREALTATTVWVTLQELPRPVYDALIVSHQASEDKDKEHRERFGVPAPYDTDTFPPALVAASAVEPQMTEEQVTDLWSKWAFSELNRLWTAALKVNSVPRNVTGFLGGSNGTRT